MARVWALLRVQLLKASPGLMAGVTAAGEGAAAACWPAGLPWQSGFPGAATQPTYADPAGEAAEQCSRVRGTPQQSRRIQCSMRSVLKGGDAACIALAVGAQEVAKLYSSFVGLPPAGGLQVFGGTGGMHASVRPACTADTSIGKVPKWLFPLLLYCAGPLLARRGGAGRVCGRRCQPLPTCCCRRREAPPAAPQCPTWQQPLMPLSWSVANVGIPTPVEQPASPLETLPPEHMPPSLPQWCYREALKVCGPAQGIYKVCNMYFYVSSGCYTVLGASCGCR
jgi:hypothetical protein